MDSFRIVKVIAIVILAMGSIAVVITSYTYLAVMPSAVARIESTANYLSAFKIPNVTADMTSADDNIRNASNDIRSAGDNLKATADSMPCAYGCGIAGVNVIDLYQMRSNLDNTASNLQSLGSDGNAMASNVNKLRNTIAMTAQVIEGQAHQTGAGLYDFTDIFQYGMLSILAVAITGVLAGIALLVLASKIEKVSLKYAR